MTTPDENTTRQQGSALDADPVPTPSSGVRGADQVDAMASEPGQGTTTGADGQTAAREALRKDLGERAAEAVVESGTGLDEGVVVGSTDDEHGGSIQAHGASGSGS